MAEKVSGTYCPLCGEIGLVRGSYRGKDWIYCPWKVPFAEEVSNPTEAHTGWTIDAADEPDAPIEVEEEIEEE